MLLIRSGEQQDELVARLERLAAVDTLTGLATRRVLDEAAKTAMSSADSHEGTSLILLDVDEFKSINDRYGHPGGDEVLVQLADSSCGPRAAATSCVGSGETRWRCCCPGAR